MSLLRFLFLVALAGAASLSSAAQADDATTPGDFLAFLTAVAASGGGAAKPTPIERFLGSHPAALRFVQTHHARYQILPLAGEQALTPRAPSAASKPLVRGPRGAESAGRQ